MFWDGMLRRCAPVAACLVWCYAAGCSSSATAPAYTPEEQNEVRKQELSEELKLLVELEKTYGMEHSHVRQKKMELGLNPDRPAAEQAP